MYQLKHHKNLDIKRWLKYSVDKQIFMIANELNRLKNGLLANLGFSALRETLERIFELLDLTISSQKGSLQKELLRFREIFSELYLLSEDELHKRLVLIEKFYRILLFMNSKTSILNS